MPSTILHLYPEWLKHFDVLESTNNYAMQLIEDGMAQHGLVVWANHQTKGKGQRGNTWIDHPDNLKFSLIFSANTLNCSPFHLSIITAVVLVQYLKIILPEESEISIKWPNDIYINDKKTCGLLIENIYRGTQWSYSVVGIGLNVNQENFPKALHKATSLSIEAENKKFDFIEIITDLRNGILNKRQSIIKENTSSLLKQYNHFLYKKGKSVLFKERDTGKKIEAFVLEVNESGQLLLLLYNGVQVFTHGSLEWLQTED